MDEKQAIARLKKGDLNGLEALVKEYQVLAVHTAYLIVADRECAEDIVQAAFLKIAAKIDGFDPERLFRPWFLRMVVNDSLKAAYRQKRESPLDESSVEVPAWLIEAGPTPEDLVVTAELRQTVWKGLQQLTPAQRAVIVQRHFLEMDEAEIVNTLQRPPSTIKWWLHTARQRLKILLAPEKHSQDTLKICPQAPGGEDEGK